MRLRRAKSVRTHTAQRSLPLTTVDRLSTHDEKMRSSPWMAIFLATLPALIGIHTRGQLGIVLADKTPLRLTPTREGQSTTALRAGETTRVERERGNYLFVRSENDVAGWVEKDRLGLIAKP